MRKWLAAVCFTALAPGVFAADLVVAIGAEITSIDPHDERTYAFEVGTQ